MDKTALLVMDVQQGIVARFGDDPAYLERLSDAIAAAHAAEIPVIYVTISFRPGHPEIAASNRTFAAAAAAGGLAHDDPATQVHEKIAPQPGDISVIKKRVSAFTGSDLEVVLRGLGVRKLVLTGIATSGVVLSTLRQAADLDFQLVVLEDGCLDADPEVHRVLTRKVFPRQAEVTTVAAWTAAATASLT
ncbi:MAG TPA: isochorismatase family cysteine hydrolase [Streptosporangiaceae bacterium]|nr:isochorismatase family cysteine hydrolase [Streptosporangiaceae bacterium]